MKTIELENKREQYESPSAKAIVVSMESIICTSPGSGTSTHRLDEDDEYVF